MRQEAIKLTPWNYRRPRFLDMLAYMSHVVRNMCRIISILAILDVIWGQTNLFPTSDRPPTPFSRKDRDSKNWIFDGFWLSPEAFIITYKVLSKEMYPQVKNPEIFFRKLDLSEFLSDFDDYYMKKYLF